MTHNELLALLKPMTNDDAIFMKDALRAVVELHTPSSIPDWVPTKEKLMCWCAHVYPCPTVKAIEKELE
jgi:hypothetical protein